MNNGTNFPQGYTINSNLPGAPQTPIYQTYQISWTFPTPDASVSVPVAEEIKEDSDGCICKKCKELFPYANPPKDGKDFICWGCSHF